MTSAGRPREYPISSPGEIPLPRADGPARAADREARPSPCLEPSVRPAGGGHPEAAGAPGLTAAASGLFFATHAGPRVPQWDVHRQAAILLASHPMTLAPDRAPVASVSARTASACRTGFTLVELLAVIAIIGVLVGLLLPAVQSSRESARRTRCANNIRQSALAVGSYESARRIFPAGCDLVPRPPALPQGTQHAWSSSILPYIDEAALAARIDYAKAWDAPGGNDVASDTGIGLYVCPSGIVSTPGKSDYGGVAGAWIVADGVPFPGVAGFTSGLLFPVDGDQRAVRAATISDGLSRTLLVAEAVDRANADAPADDPAATGRWARLNCFAQATSFINTRGSDIASNHHGGAHAAYADSHIDFLDETMDPVVLAAICTRGGGEASAPHRR